MNNTIETMDLTRLLPPTLKQDPKMIALSKIIAGELKKTNAEIRKNIIYARIDELDEQTLDVLGYDLHVDWYDYGYPIEAKRAVIKDSVRVHKRLGTLYAVRTALGSVYPESEVEEWFDYNGRPHTFRVVLDVTQSRAPAEYFSIKKAVESYKRLSAQMESLIYQCRIEIQIATETEVFQHLTGYAGRRLAGTYPQRNTLAALAGVGIALQPDGGGYRFTSPEAGTKPQRAVAAALRASVVQASGEGVQFSFKATATGRSKAGEEPYRNTTGALAFAEVEASATADGFRFTSQQAGTEPHRSTTAEFTSTEVEASATADGFEFTSQQAGTEPHRSATVAFVSAEVETYPTGAAYGFISQPAGAQPTGARPERSTTAEGKQGGIIPEVTAESFIYRVKRCGTDRCKDK